MNKGEKMYRFDVQYYDGRYKTKKAVGKNYVEAYDKIESKFRHLIFQYIEVGECDKNGDFISESEEC